MGTYLRKAFNVGPLRFNLSKSGIGCSIGVTGARVGINSKGQAYTHAGRFGLYHRQMLNGSRTSEAPAGRQQRSRRSSEVREIEVDTGVAFVAEQPRFSLEESTVHIPEPDPPKSWGALWTVASGVVAILGIVLASWFILFTSTATLIYGLVSILRRHRALRATRQLEEALGDLETDDQTAAGAIRAIFSASRARIVDKVYWASACHYCVSQHAAKKGDISSNELGFLRSLESNGGIDIKFAKRSKLCAFRQAYISAVADHELTVAEESQLANLRAKLEIQDHEIEQEANLLRVLSELRELSLDRLKPIETAFKMGSDEVCYLEVRARILKRKVIGRHQKQGTRYKEMGYETEKDGTLVVTSKRVMLVHEGVSSVPHNKIQGINVDVEKAIISLAKDGRKTPIFYTAPDVLRVGAMIALLSSTGI